jgi:hypothetical protein
MRPYNEEMKKLIITMTLILAASAGFSDGGDATEGAVTGEISAPADLDTILDFDPNLDFAQIVFVEARFEAAGTWYFSVAVRHEDEGWDHYADLWEVVDPESSIVYGERILAHPHETEQPFTRTQSGIEIPGGVSAVLVRAKCTVHGFFGKAVLADFTIAKGDNFKVVR